jgi:hypothetical protein
MDYLWQGSMFPLEDYTVLNPLPFPTSEYPTEFPLTTSTSYNQDESVTTSAVHVIPHQSGFPDNHMALPPSLYTNDTGIQSHQLLSSNNTSATNMQLMAPPPNRRKRKAPTLRSDDWEPVKARVIDLHITQKQPLPKVKQIIEEEFKISRFSAT